MSLQPDIDLPTTPLSQLYEILLPITVPSSSPKARFTNWVKTFVCTSPAVFEPRSEYECQVILELARKEGKAVRVTGVGQSPSDLRRSNEFMLRTTYLNRILSVDKEKRRVIVEGGITLHDLHIALVKNDLPTINLGSIPNQSLAGIVTTASYRSGIEYGVMSTAIVSLTLLLANGSRVQCSRSEQPDLFLATTCGLGSTGIILNIELDVELSFHLDAFESRSFARTVTSLDQIVRFLEHTRIFWVPATDNMCISTLSRTNESKRYGTSWIYDSLKKYPIVQLLLFLRIYIRKFKTWAAWLASWFFSSGLPRGDDSYCISNVDDRTFRHTAWTILFEDMKPCLRELRKHFHETFDNPRERPYFSIEIHFSAPDGIWPSPSYDQKTCWIGMVQCKSYHFSVPYGRLFDGFERILSRYQDRPHRTKAHKLDTKEEVTQQREQGSESQGSLEEHWENHARSSQSNQLHTGSITREHSESEALSSIPPHTSSFSSSQPLAMASPHSFSSASVHSIQGSQINSAANNMNTTNNHPPNIVNNGGSVTVFNIHYGSGHA
ncbi:hypothetical protein GYMLUDRAFT_225236 [Collybiopsis luxurians FD-317 M1]|uniref:D-arabinono-1,4-lactone oxidase n=1 Tax=Collybiopsis luxurians FD-317 M1 TaxID=944289 RepID=A0A0D0CXR9_9AGAR|nr:hypothetical protein GYMLUDRAFT_225236 [Collybiopsis luxurians FD-317 M1]